jgi:hypothetical protein
MPLPILEVSFHDISIVLGFFKKINEVMNDSIFVIVYIFFLMTHLSLVKRLMIQTN